MSLADDVLARHVEAFCNLCKPTHSRGTCRVCFIEAWPCAAVRLATQLRAAEQVVEAARDLVKVMAEVIELEDLIWGGKAEDPLQAVWAALAEYDKGPL